MSHTAACAAERNPRKDSPVLCNCGFDDKKARLLDRLLDPSKRDLEWLLCDCAGPFPEGTQHEPYCWSGHERRIRDELTQRLSR